MRLLEAVHARVRVRHLSPRTEQAYAGWVKRFVRYHGCRHPREMGDREIGLFLTSLAVDANVSASTQNQALARCSSCTARCWAFQWRWATKPCVPSEATGFPR